MSRDGNSLTRLPRGLSLSEDERLDRAGNWFKSFVFGDLRAKQYLALNNVFTKAEAEDADAAGGAVVATEILEGILEYRERVGAFLAGCGGPTPMRRDDAARPRRSGGIEAAWVEEGASVPESTAYFDSVGLVPKKITFLVKVSRELAEDSAQDVAAYLNREFGHALARAIDDCGFNGDGTSAFAGTVGLGMALNGFKSAVTAGSGHDTFAKLDIADLSNLVAGVRGDALPSARWFTSALGFALVFCRLATSGGLVQSLDTAGARRASFMGWPVEISAKLPNVATTLANKPMLYFGDLSRSSMVAERRALRLRISEHRFIERDQVAVMGTMRGAIVNHSVGSATEAGPVAVLTGTS